MYTQEQIERAARVLAEQFGADWDYSFARRHYINLATEVARELDGGV